MSSVFLNSMSDDPETRYALTVYLKRKTRKSVIALGYLCHTRVQMTAIRNTYHIFPKLNELMKKTLHSQMDHV